MARRRASAAPRRLRRLPARPARPAPAGRRARRGARRGRRRASSTTNSATLAGRTGWSRCGTIQCSCASIASARRCGQADARRRVRRPRRAHDHQLVEAEGRHGLLVERRQARLQRRRQQRRCVRQHDDQVAHAAIAKHRGKRRQLLRRGPVERRLAAVDPALPIEDHERRVGAQRPGAQRGSRHRLEALHGRRDRRVDEHLHAAEHDERAFEHRRAERARRARHHRAAPRRDRRGARAGTQGLLQRRHAGTVACRVH